MRFLQAVTAALVVLLSASCAHAQDSTCTNGDIRLTDEPSSNSTNSTATRGRVEVCLNGVWDVVCNNYWDARDARVVCRQLGYAEADSAIGLLTEYSNEIVGGSFPLDYVDCEGNETRLIDCRYPCEGCMPSFCEHHAGVDCFPQGATCTNGEIRLTGGNVDREGRIEICFLGYWGTVCGSRYDWTDLSFSPVFMDLDASVTCRQLGYPSGISLSDISAFGAGTGPIYLDNVECNGTESRLADCPHSDVNVYGNCWHFSDARVKCFECAENDTRLAGEGSSATRGRVEICVSGEWATICHNFWDAIDAQVVCRQLGFESDTAIGLLGYGGGEGEFALNYLNCSGEEEGLSECPVCDECIASDTRVCQHIHDAGVDCFPQGTNCTDGNIRLVDGTSHRDGRIEVCFRGYWGTVCRRQFDWSTVSNEELVVFREADAMVACRQLGFLSQGPTVYEVSSSVPAMVPIFLGGLRCNGTEERLADCPHPGVNNYGNCTPHLNDAAVICRECIEGDVRLVGGSSQTEGRVEFCSNGEWGTICHNLWDGRDASVVCRQLGHQVDTPLAIMNYGGGEGPIHRDNVQCEGTELVLGDCQYGMDTSLCQHSFDAGVICNTQGDECSINGSVRLVNGSGLLSLIAGRVEICYQGYWGTICGWNSGTQVFDDVAASVVCRQIGFSTGAVLPLNSEYVDERYTGPILLNGAQCSGTEKHLYECSISRINEYEGCLHSVDVAVVCHDCTEGEVRLVNGTTPTEGTVEMCNNGSWVAICQDYWDANEAQVVCLQLGYDTNTAIGLVRSGEVSADPYFISVNCTGSETTLSECPLCRECDVTASSCKVEVSCFPQGNECQDGMVRLENGSSSTQGRVEICFRGIWGSVCGWHYDMSTQAYMKTFTSTEALVVCRQLGFNSEGAVETELATFGQSSGPIFLDNVRCSGTEEMISECHHTGINVYSTCGNISNAGVICTTATTISTLVVVLASMAGGVVMIILLLAVCILVPYICRRRAARKKERNAEYVRQLLNQVVDRNRYLTRQEASDLLRDHREDVDSDKHVTTEFMSEDILTEMQIPFSDLQLLETLGQGEFGIVYKAQLHKPVVAPRRLSDTKAANRRSRTFSIASQTGSILSSDPPTVAVKTVKGFFNKENVRALMEEVKKMLDFDHPHVLSVIGLCLDAGAAPYIVIPFMANGSLLSYLRKERASLVIASDADEDTICALTKRMTDMCLQVAKGMEYLADMKIIHRDLAARNCMIDSGWIIKVADFGLAESTATKDYFRQEENSDVKLPVKWMAIESLHDGIFSEKSDVWSFGVTCWEVFSGGKTPYPGLDPIRVIELLDIEERLSKPKNGACSDTMFLVMQQCWAGEPKDRPTFSELVQSLSKHLGTLSDYMDVSTFQPVVAASRSKHLEGACRDGEFLPLVIENEDSCDAEQ